MATAQNKVNRKRVIGDINYDIEKGVYKNFPVVKNRLTYISQKMSTACYCVNSEELSAGEVKTLVENDYIDSYFLGKDPSQIF